MILFVINRHKTRREVFEMTLKTGNPAYFEPQYINDLLKVIITFFRYAQKEEYILVNPSESIKNVKQPKIITFSELEIRRMLGHYHGRDYLSVRNRTLLALFFDTGMRLNEVITLFADQTRDEYILVHGKGNKERWVPVSPYLAKALMQFQSVRHGCFDDRIHEKHSTCFCPAGAAR